MTELQRLTGCSRAFLFCASLLVLGPACAHASSCEPAGTMRVVVDLAPPAGKTIAGVKIDLDYPEHAVTIPGFGDASDVKTRVTGMPEGFLGVPNDLDDDLIVAIAGTSGLPRGPIFTVEFDRCKGAPQPAAKDFHCKVEQASTDTGVLVDGATCAATLAHDGGTGTTATSKKKVKEGSL